MQMSTPRPAQTSARLWVTRRRSSPAARRRERLETLAGRLSEHHGVRIEVFPADLTLPITPEHLFAFTKEQRIAVDLLVNNAGFGAYGRLIVIFADGRDG